MLKNLRFPKCLWIKGIVLIELIAIQATRYKANVKYCGDIKRKTTIYLLPKKANPKISISQNDIENAVSRHKPSFSKIVSKIPAKKIKLYVITVIKRILFIKVF